MTRYRKRNNFQNTFKDYLVPIIGGVLLLLVLFSIFNKDSSTPTTGDITSDENRNPVDISFNSESTEAFISYPNGTKEEITDSQNFYKGETIIVKEGSLNLVFVNNTKVALNKIAELKYNEDGNLSLYSSDAWITLGADTNIDMKYASVSAPSGSVISLTQNEAGSTVYVLSGSAKISNLEGVSTSLIKGQKVSVPRKFAASSDIDLSSEKGSIDSYFKGSDWFIDNKGFEILEQEDTTVSSDNILEEMTGTGSSGDFLSFNSLSDEMSTNKNSLDISGKILSSTVSSVSINNKQASINTSDMSFTVNGVTLGSSINDLAVKVYGADKNILEKKVITVYSSSTISSVNPDSTTTVTPVASSGGATFGVDATDFGFTSPTTSGKFVATGSEITIRGITTAENITKVEVNGFKLASFNGSTWRYHAFERFETLEEGTNQYKVDYFGSQGELVYTDYYTIVKKPAVAASVVTETTDNKVEIISDEAITE